MEQMKLEIPGLEELLLKFEALTAEVKWLRDSTITKKVVSVSDIARMEGVSRSSLYGMEKYLLPRFGVSAYPDGVARWDLEEYLRWREISPVERKVMYQRTIIEDQKKISAKKQRKVR